MSVPDGIAYMHARNVAHRDIKIENLMFASHESKDIKIGDFGLAKQLVRATDQERW
jgi:serine/threonine protein kinase